MEKQAETMLESMVSRIDHYPGLRARLEWHIFETKGQITLQEEVLDRNGISRSVLKGSAGKMAALGKSVGGTFNSDKIVKGTISGCVFEHVDIACYSALVTAEKGGGYRFRADT